MASIKFIASQARTIFQYKNTRTKVLKCCANIYFNKQCLINIHLFFNHMYEGWNFNSGNYLFTTDTK